MKRILERVSQEWMRVEKYSRG